MTTHAPLRTLLEFPDVVTEIARCILDSGDRVLSIVFGLLNRSTQKAWTDLPDPWIAHNLNLVTDRVACDGHLELLQWFHNRGFPLSQNICHSAARKGRLDVLKWLRSDRALVSPSAWNHHVLLHAIQGGHMHVFDWALSQGLGHLLDEQTCAEAAGAGNLDLLKWLRNRDPQVPWDEHTCAMAARAGRLDIVQWARRQKPPIPWHAWTVAFAVRSGSMELLEWLLAQGCPHDHSATCDAARQGNLPALRMVIRHFNSWTFMCAVMSGRLECVQYLDALGCTRDASACSHAALEGHLHILQWLREPGSERAPWDARTCANAALVDRLDILQWARQHGCPWDEYTCAHAAEAGSVRILQWARAQSPPAPWNEATSFMACEAGSLDVLRWARQQNPPVPWTVNATCGAAGKGHLNVLRFLRSGPDPCPWQNETFGVFRSAAYSGQLHVLKWALANGCPTMHLEWERVPIHVARWLKRRGLVPNT